MNNANKTSVNAADIRCTNGNVNGHYDGSCERTDCQDGTLLCDCGERPAVTRVDDGSAKGLLQCAECMAEAAALEEKWEVDEKATAAETKRRLAAWDELQRAWLEAGAAIRAERARGAA
jgi:hypothetical protein